MLAASSALASIARRRASRRSLWRRLFDEDPPE